MGTGSDEIVLLPLKMGLMKLSRLLIIIIFKFLILALIFHLFWFFTGMLLLS